MIRYTYQVITDRLHQPLTLGFTATNDDTLLAMATTEAGPFETLQEAFESLRDLSTRIDVQEVMFE